MKATTRKVMCGDGRIRIATFRESGPIDRAFVRVTVDGTRKTVTGRVFHGSDPLYPEDFRFVPDVGLLNEGAIRNE